MLSTVDMVVQRRDGPRRLRDHDDDDDDDESQAVAIHADLNRKATKHRQLPGPLYRISHDTIRYEVLF